MLGVGLGPRTARKDAESAKGPATGESAACLAKRIEARCGGGFGAEVWNARARKTGKGGGAGSLRE